MISENLKKLNIVIPNAPDPVGAYVAFKIINKFLFISGQLPIGLNGNIIKGKIGKDLSLEKGQEAAKFCALNILAQLKKKCGSLDKVKGCVKITGYVNSADSFIDQPKIINGASNLISNIFGDQGKHARAAISVNSLPLGAAVEVDGIFKL